MPAPDLNLLFTLDVLLAEGSVAGAARRLRLSPSAMSRALQRLRDTTGDPLLVRAGRGMVPSPRAVALRDEVHRLVHAAESVLRPARVPDLGRLERTVALRTREGFVDNFGAALVARIGRDAPGVRLRFVPKLATTPAGLRDGTVDLETGVVGPRTGPELRAHPLFRDRFVGVVRSDHPLARGRVTFKRFLAARHALVARDGRDKGPVDAAVATRGGVRQPGAVVEGFSAALALARGSDLVAAVPERHTGVLRAGLHTFALPVAVAPFTLSLLWHPRFDGDPVHRWLRECVREVCGADAGAA